MAAWIFEEESVNSNWRELLTSSQSVRSDTTGTKRTELGTFMHSEYLTEFESNGDGGDEVLSNYLDEVSSEVRAKMRWIQLSCR